MFYMVEKLAHDRTYYKKVYEDLLAIPMEGKTEMQISQHKGRLKRAKKKADELEVKFQQCKEKVIGYVNSL